MHPVVVLFNRIGPYHRARAQACAARFPTVAVETTSVDHTYDWDPVLTPELTRVTIFPGIEPRSRLELVERVSSTLSELRPRAVAIPGWSTPAALAALQWCINSGTPAVLMSESQPEDFARRWWKEAIKRRLVGLFSSGLAGGAPHVAYLTALGMPVERVFSGYDVVDNEHFAGGAVAARADAGSVREHLGLPERFFLASSRFIEKKNLNRLLEAFARFRSLASDTDWKLVLLGDGPLKPGILATASRLRLNGDLLLPGFQQYDALPAYYGLASAFVHASTVEQWGLVVNEAMSAGLPVLVSDRCGCAADLVRGGVNGFTFDPFDTESLARRMVEISDSCCDREAMGAQSRRIIAEWAPSRFGAALAQAIECSATSRAVSSFDEALLHLLIRKWND